MVTDVRAARLLCTEAARLKDEGDAATVMATWVAKYFASTAAARPRLRRCRSTAPTAAERTTRSRAIYRDAKVMEIIEGSTEIQRMHDRCRSFREWKR